MTIFIGSTAAGSRRTLVAKTSMNSRTRALSRVCSCGDPLKVIFDINSSGVSVGPSSDSTSKGLAFHSMSSSSSSGSNRSFFLMRSSAEIVGCFLCTLCCGVKGRPDIEHRVLSYPIALRSVQVMHGREPLHVAVLLVWSEEPLSINDSFLSCGFISWGSSFE